MGLHNIFILCPSSPTASEIVPYFEFVLFCAEIGWGSASWHHLVQPECTAANCHIQTEEEEERGRGRTMETRPDWSAPRGLYRSEQCRAAGWEAGQRVRLMDVTVSVNLQGQQSVQSDSSNNKTIRGCFCRGFSLVFPLLYNFMSLSLVVAWDSTYTCSQTPSRCGQRFCCLSQYSFKTEGNTRRWAFAQGELDRAVEGQTIVWSGTALPQPHRMTSSGLFTGRFFIKLPEMQSTGPWCPVLTV